MLKIVHSLSLLVSFLLITVMTNDFDVCKSVIGTGTLSKTVSLCKNMNVLKHVTFVFLLPIEQYIVGLLCL